MAKKIIMTEAMFNRTRNYILQRNSRVMTSVQTMKEQAGYFLANLKHEYGQDFPTYVQKIEESLNEFIEYVDNMVNV